MHRFENALEDSLRIHKPTAIMLLDKVIEELEKVDDKEDLEDATQSLRIATDLIEQKLVD